LKNEVSQRTTSKLALKEHHVEFLRKNSERTEEGLEGLTADRVFDFLLGDDYKATLVIEELYLSDINSFYYYAE